MPYKKNDILIICIIFLLTTLIFIFFPTKKIELYIGNSSSIIDYKYKSIIVKLKYSDREKIKYRIYPFFVKVYIKPVYYGNKIGIYKNGENILIKNNNIYDLSKIGTYNILTIDYFIFKKKYKFYIIDGDLPVINIDLIKKDKDRKEKTPVLMTIKSDNKSVLFENKEAVIRERGNNEYKKYNIWFSKPISLFGLPKRKKLSLIGDINDMVYFREKVSFDLYGLIDSKKKYPKTFFVELFINGIYKGVYILEENYDYELFGYKKYSNEQLKPAIIFRCSKHIVLSSNFKSRIEDILKDSKTFYKKFGYYFKQDKPSKKKENCLKDIWDLIFFIFNSSNNEFYDKNKGIYSKIDINSVIDVFLLVQLIRNVDCISNNLYFSRKEIENINDKPLFVMSSWDHDRALGCHYGKKINHQKIIGLNNSGKKVNILFQRLFNNPEIRQRIKNRWFELRNDRWSNKSIFKMIEQHNKMINSANYRIENQYIYENNKNRSYTQQDEINYRIKWLKLRLSWLDDYFSKI